MSTATATYRIEQEALDRLLDRDLSDRAFRYLLGMQLDAPTHSSYIHAADAISYQERLATPGVDQLSRTLRAIAQAAGDRDLAALNKIATAAPAPAGLHEAQTSLHEFVTELINQLL